VYTYLLRHGNITQVHMFCIISRLFHANHFKVLPDIRKIDVDAGIQSPGNNAGSPSNTDKNDNSEGKNAAMIIQIKSVDHDYDHKKCMAIWLFCTLQSKDEGKRIECSVIKRIIACEEEIKRIRYSDYDGVFNFNQSGIVCVLQTTVNYVSGITLSLILIGINLLQNTSKILLSKLSNVLTNSPSPFPQATGALTRSGRCSGPSLRPTLSSIRCLSYQPKSRIALRNASSACPLLGK
jgi:hypothetical protein